MAEVSQNEVLNTTGQNSLEIELMEDDLNIIQKLDDAPNDVGGMTSAELKAAFDRAGLLIQAYINETLVPAIRAGAAIGQDYSAAEAERVANEQARTVSEAARTRAETQRSAEESVRVAAEEGRVKAEQVRAAAENGRAKAETDRVSAEAARAQEEAKRAAAEAARAQAETNRTSAENARADAETERANAETTRSSNEAQRVSAESGRAQAERDRAAAEAARVQAEKARADSTTGIVARAEAAAAAAEKAKADAEASVTAGSMDPNVYDPQGKKTDVFDYIDKRLAESGGEGTTAEVSEIDFTDWEDGSFTVTMDDGTTKDGTVEFDADGNPESITLDGNTLTITLP